MWSSFAYHEPTITAILILISFLYLLNVAGWMAQALVSAGLLGQIFIGIVFGTPLAGWLPDAWEETLVALGYVGLLLIVFEGGMQSSVSHLAAILPLAIAVALTGILAPIGLSFVLMPLMGPPTLHAFAAGSSLASTSLGTVLAVLQPASIGFNLQRTNLGATLLAAAVMDDVVAFVLAKVLTVLGSSETGSGTSLGADIGRTIGVTIGLGVVWALVTRFALRPILQAFTQRAHLWEQKPWGGDGPLLLIDALILIGLIAATGFAGTSPLYGAYVGGLSIAYLCADTPDSSADTLDSDVSLADVATPACDSFPSSISPPQTGTASNAPASTLLTVFEHHVAAPLNALLLPIFFASIGYSIPFVPMWRGHIIWRGIVYAALMTIGKLLCGFWILLYRGRPAWRGAVFLGMAMVARGEIGLLIAQIAHHTPDPLLDEDEFLVVIWGVVVCTFVGPMGVGWAVKRWNKTVLAGGIS